MPDRLQRMYSKELAKELGKIAVYLPGEPIEVGDIITFPFGNSILGRPRPIGSFKKVTSLKNLGITYPEPTYSNRPDTYRFASKNAVNIEFDLGGSANLGNEQLPSGAARTRIGFAAEGAIYFLGVDCDKKQLDDLNILENEVNDKGKSLLWKDTYLVTSVTVAKKAFIAQSRSKTSELQLSGDVKGIQSGAVDIKANSGIKIERQQGDMFIKDWSDDVTVFMDLVKFEREVFGQSTKSVGTSSDKQERDFRIHFKPVNITELITD